MRTLPTRRLVGGGLDVVVETAGAVDAVELSTRSPARVVASSRSESRARTASSRFPRTASRSATSPCYGSVGYTTAAWAQMVALLRAQLVDLDPIVTHRFPLERFEDAFALMDERRGVVARIVLEHAS